MRIRLSLTRTVLQHYQVRHPTTHNKGEEEVKMRRTCFDLISAPDCNILLCTNDDNDKYK